MDKEQPKEILSSPVSEENDISVAEDKNELGSLNKFKDVKSLEEAYINLQSEFTRKCQKLSELEKKSLTVLQNDNLENSEPFYNSDVWHENVKNFLHEYPNANKYANEIAGVLLSDKVLASQPNSLEIAYNKVIAQKFKTNEEIINDENFINNYVLNNEKIKDKIIKDYINKIKTSSPKVISTSKFASFGLTPDTKPKTLEEAKAIASRMFNT